MSHNLIISLIIYFSTMGIPAYGRMKIRELFTKIWKILNLSYQA